MQRAVVRVGADGRLTASTTGPQASSRLASLVGANALLVVPPGKDELPAGSIVEAIADWSARATGADVEGPHAEAASRPATIGFVLG